MSGNHDLSDSAGLSSSVEHLSAFPNVTAVVDRPRTEILGGVRLCFIPSEPSSPAPGPRPDTPPESSGGGTTTPPDLPEPASRPEPRASASPGPAASASPRSASATRPRTPCAPSESSTACGNSPTRPRKSSDTPREPCSADPPPAGDSSRNSILSHALSFLSPIARQSLLLHSRRSR